VELLDCLLIEEQGCDLSGIGLAVCSFCIRIVTSTTRDFRRNISEIRQMIPFIRVGRRQGCSVCGRG